MKKNIILSILLFILFLNLEKFVNAQEDDKKDEVANINNPEEAEVDTKVTEEKKPEEGTSDTTTNTTTDTTSDTKKLDEEKSDNKTAKEETTKSKTSEEGEKEHTEEKKPDIKHLPIAQYWDTVETDNIEVRIHCLYGRENQCKIFKKQMKEIIKTIEKAIVIKKEIRISLFLMNLEYLCGNCLSVVLPPSFIYVKETNSDKVYSVPQALAKQLDIEGLKKDSLPDADFTMLINVNQEDVDIEQFGEFALIREVLHGMGIITSGDLVNSNSYFLYEDDFYAPQRAPIFVLDDDDVYGVDVTFKRFYPISIFEKNIVTQADPNNFIFSELNDMYKVQFPQQSYNYMNITEEEEKQTLLDSYEPFLTSSYYEPAKKIAQLYKQKGSVGFKTSDGSVIPLQTFDDEYIKSCSITHIDIPKVKKYSFYDYDPFNKKEIKEYLNADFILNYTYMFSYKMDKILPIVNKDYKYKFLSPNILKILTTLGWTEKDKKPNPVKYQIAKEVKIAYDNYMDSLMRASDQHDYYGYGSFAGNLVCHPKAYALTIVAMGLIFGI